MGCVRVERSGMKPLRVMGYRGGTGVAGLAITGDFADAVVGTAYSSSLPITGGSEPYTLTGGTGVASGSLDTGFALSITGSTGAYFLTLACASPASSGTMTFTASVDSDDGQTATSAQSIAITSTTYRDAVLADAPLHYYRFNETSGTTLINSGTSGINGTYGTDASNWTGPGLISGDTNKGLLIPTATINTAIVNGGAVGNTDFSVEVVIKPAGVASGASGGVIWSYGPAASSCPGIDYIDVGGGQFKLRYMRVGTAEIFRSASAYAYGTKLHVVMRYTRSTHLCEMWINGVKEASTGTFTATTASSTMTIANQNFPPWITFCGAYDELAYYNYLLSPARIAAHAALV